MVSNHIICIWIPVNLKHMIRKMNSCWLGITLGAKQTERTRHATQKYYAVTPAIYLTTTMPSTGNGCSQCDFMVCVCPWSRGTATSADLRLDAGCPSHFSWRLLMLTHTEGDDLPQTGPKGVMCYICAWFTVKGIILISPLLGFGAAPAFLHWNNPF